MGTAEEQAPTLSAQNERGPRHTILIVDDSPTQSKLLEHLLNADGYRVLVRHDGIEALADIAAVKPDLVISDILMPGIDGFEFCRKIREMEGESQLPVILLTHLNDPTHVLRSLAAGANYFLSKPYKNEILLSRVAAALRRENGCCVTGEDGLVSCSYYGNRYDIKASKPQIIDLLLATYELAVEKNQEILKAQEALKLLNEELETRVAERTVKLRNSISELRQEIAERESAEECVRRLNRLHAVLSETSKAVVRMKDRDALFRDFCRIAVDHGSFRLAWVGLVDKNGESVQVVAARGTTAYLDGISITLNQGPTGNGPTATAIREGTFYICNDFLGASVTAPLARPWRGVRHPRLGEHRATAGRARHRRPHPLRGQEGLLRPPAGRALAADGRGHLLCAREHGPGGPPPGGGTGSAGGDGAAPVRAGAACPEDRIPGPLRSGHQTSQPLQPDG